jgi:type II secretory pathway component PulC
VFVYYPVFTYFVFLFFLLALELFPQLHATLRGRNQMSFSVILILLLLSLFIFLSFSSEYVARSVREENV